MSNALSILREAARDFVEDKAPRLGAALAFYTTFSIAPLLLIAISLAGLVFGEEAARGEIFAQTRGLLGATAASAVEEMVQSSSRPGAGVMGTIIGIVALLFGASGVFTQLKDALNTIWEVPAKKKKGWLGMVRARFFSLAMVLVIGFLLLVSLLLDTAISAVGDGIGTRLPGGEALWHTVQIGVSLALVTLLFALVYRYVPDVRIPWRDVWLGAILTAVLFALGKFALGFYLGKKAADSGQGFGGALLIFLLWVYYSAQILFFGAEVTQVVAKRHGEAGDRG